MVGTSAGVQMNFNIEVQRPYVVATPSSPDGYFYVDDPAAEVHTTKLFVLDGVKPRHRKPLHEGKPRTIDRYVADDPERPGFVRFQGCNTFVPNPLQPARPLIGVQGLCEVKLDRTDSTADAFQAVGAWWAQQVLRPTFDNGEGDISTADIPSDILPELEQAAGDFALVLAGLAREQDMRHLLVDYGPDPLLAHAAEVTFIPPGILPIKSHTVIDNNGTATARLGYRGEVTQIWPPTNTNHPIQ